MTIPQLSLLLCAMWTAGILIVAIGWYRWSRILLGTAAINSFPADDSQGSDWYRRAMRAHANCIENLPVYGVVVFVLSARGISSPVVDGLALLIIPSRIVQSLTHICFVQTARAVSIRFSAFSVQLACFMALAGYALWGAR
ncbi:MAG TPA: MAPEG family protein [Polyangiaceae bacterium]|nr:MAPEG family protein [Polyangiaceae bacterium]